MRAHVQGTSERLENRDLLVEALGWVDGDSLVVSVTRTASAHPAETTRLFEANVNMMKTQDQMISELVNRVLKA